MLLLLWLKVKDTKSESNSQHYLWPKWCILRCGSRSKIQNLKAIHNILRMCSSPNCVVAQGQRYKIWKQFTTYKRTYLISNSCGSRSKIQNLKAIHNDVDDAILFYMVVAQGQRYKIWKQFTTLCIYAPSDTKLWLKVKDTKSESNSQHTCHWHPWQCSCGSRSKIQNLKAIHNLLVLILVRMLLWLKVKDTKSESNSQPTATATASGSVVAQGQRYKIWKQFTTCFHNF